jgi:tRNA(Ile)-lysidine synthase
VEALARYAELAAEAAEYMDHQSARAFERLGRPDGGGLSISIPRLLRVHPALQKLVLRQAIKECRKSLKGIASSHIDRLLLLCRSGESGSQIPIPGKLTAVRQFSDLVFLPSDGGSRRSFSYKLRSPGEVRVPEAGVNFYATLGDRHALGTLRSSRSRVLLDAESLPPILTIRSRRPGDRYGGSNHRKVKKMLIDARIPLRSRESIPMVAVGESVVWIPGFKPAKPFALHQESTRCLVLEARSLDSGTAAVEHELKPFARERSKRWKLKRPESV